MLLIKSNGGEWRGLVGYLGTIFSYEIIPH